MLKIKRGKLWCNWIFCYIFLLLHKHPLNSNANRFWDDSRGDVGQHVDFLSLCWIYF